MKLRNDHVYKFQCSQIDIHTYHTESNKAICTIYLYEGLLIDVLDVIYFILFIFYLFFILLFGFFCLV